jgi:hypothetical protein
MNSVGVHDPHLERILHAALTLGSSGAGDCAGHAVEGFAKTRALRPKI